MLVGRERMRLIALRWVAAITVAWIMQSTAVQTAHGQTRVGSSAAGADIQAERRRCGAMQCSHAVCLTSARVACSFDIHRLLFPVRSASAAAPVVAGRSRPRPSALRRTHPRRPRPPVAAASAGGERAAPQPAPSHSTAATSCPAAERCWTAAVRWRWLTAAAAVAVSRMDLTVASPAVCICVDVSPWRVSELRVGVCSGLCGREEMAGTVRIAASAEREGGSVSVALHCCSIDEEGQCQIDAHCRSLHATGHWITLQRTAHTVLKMQCKVHSP